jgi:hypothetical protein
MNAKKNNFLSLPTLISHSSIFVCENGKLLELFFAAAADE